jgi:hypothetical protein
MTDLPPADCEYRYGAPRGAYGVVPVGLLFFGAVVWMCVKELLKHGVTGHYDVFGLRGWEAGAFLLAMLVTFCSGLCALAWVLVRMLLSTKRVIVTADGIAGPRKVYPRTTHIAFRDVTDCVFLYTHPLLEAEAPYIMAGLVVCSSSDQVFVEARCMACEDFVRLSAAVLAATQWTTFGGGLRQAFRSAEAARREIDPTCRLCVTSSAINQRQVMATEGPGLLVSWTQRPSPRIELAIARDDPRPTAVHMDAPIRLHPALVDGCFILFAGSMVGWGGTSLWPEVRPRRRMLLVWQVRLT